MNKESALIDLESGTAAKLIAASEDFVEYFETQRRHYGHHCLGGLRLVSCHSHQVFRYLGKGNLVEAQVEFSYCQKQYDELLEHLEIIPGLLAMEIKNDAGQELCEAAMGLRFYPVLTGEIDIDDVVLPTCDELKMTPQAWLGGIADVSSELSKLAEAIHARQILTGKLAMSSSDLYARLLAILDGIQQYFYRYAGSYPKILSASTRRFQGFHNKERLVGSAPGWTIKSLLGFAEEKTPEEAFTEEQ